MLRDSISILTPNRAGTVRVGGFDRHSGLVVAGIVRELAVTHPRVEVAISEYEPLEAFDLLVDDDLDLAITYDYNLAPASPDSYPRNGCALVHSVGFGRSGRYRDEAISPSSMTPPIWIVNSRNTADEDAVRTLGALAGFHAPRSRIRSIAWTLSKT